LSRKRQKLTAATQLGRMDLQTSQASPHTAKSPCLRPTKLLQDPGPTICPKLLSSPSVPVATFDSTLASDYTADFDCADCATEPESERKIQNREWQSDSLAPFDGPSTDTYLGSDTFFSDYLHSQSPSCSSTQESQDCNAELSVDVPDDSFALTSNTEPLPTEFVNVDNDLDRLHEDCQVKPDRPRVRLRINPPKARIILRLTRPKHVARL
jgi:hypothetical protein